MLSKSSHHHCLNSDNCFSPSLSWHHHHLSLPSSSPSSLHRHHLLVASVVIPHYKPQERERDGTFRKNLFLGLVGSVMVGKCTNIFKLLSRENETTLLVWWDAFLVLDFGFHIIDNV